MNVKGYCYDVRIMLPDRIRGTILRQLADYRDSLQRELASPEGDPEAWPFLRYMIEDIGMDMAVVTYHTAPSVETMQ